MSAEPSKHRLILPLEGYRALAIIAVLLFHLDFVFAPAGFLGVDIFFVISGYIITKNIQSKLASGEFSLKTFYLKRYRRLFPALIVTVFATLIGSFFILSPSDFSDLGKSAFYSVFSLANINFWMEAGYFDTASHSKPLLHMWSLSVEEQFYLFWPAFLVFAYGVFKASQSKLVVAIAVLFALSLAATFMIANSATSTAFFWFPFRVFQFMAGAIIAVSGFKIKSIALANLSNLAGLILFCAACYIMSNSTHIGIAGLAAAVSGALLLISMESRLAQTVFGNPIGVAIGQHSYSIYLVHWPLIVLFKSASGTELDILEKLILAAISIILAVGLRALVEQPLRIKSKPSGLQIPFPTAITTIFLGLVIFGSTTIWGYRGFPSRVPDQIRALMQQDDSFRAKMRFGDCFLSTRGHSMSDLKPFCYDPKAITGKKARKNMVIIGSSLAADTYHGINKQVKGWNVMQITSAKCQPTPETSKLELCNEVKDFIFNDALVNYKYDLVVLSGLNPKSTNASEQLQKYFETSGTDYVVLGPRPVFSETPISLINQHSTMTGLDNWMNQHLDGTRENEFAFDDKHYFSLRDAFCKKENSCKWRDDDQLFYRDTSHFSPAGSEYLGKEFNRWLARRD